MSHCSIHHKITDYYAISTVPPLSEREDGLRLIPFPPLNPRPRPHRGTSSLARRRFLDPRQRLERARGARGRARSRGRGRLCDPASPHSTRTPPGRHRRLLRGCVPPPLGAW